MDEFSKVVNFAFLICANSRILFAIFDVCGTATNYCIHVYLKVQTLIIPFTDTLLVQCRSLTSIFT